MSAEFKFLIWKGYTPFTECQMSSKKSVKLNNPSLTAPLCLHGPATEDLQCKAESDPVLHHTVIGEWAGTFVGLFSKTMLYFLLSIGSLFIKDQAELLSEKNNNVGKEVKLKAIYVYTVCLKPFIFIF